MVDENEQSGATKAKGKKDKTAVEGNAPGGDEFRDPNSPMASGGDAVLGDQVEKRNQALGLKADPGPVIHEQHKHLNWRNPKARETLNGANPDGLKVRQRVSTAPDHFSNGENISDVTLGAHVIGLESKASDVYNPERGDALSDKAEDYIGTEGETKASEPNFSA